MAALDISLFGLATAAAAGAISFLSPCVLPLVPGYLSYVAGGARTTGSGDAVSRLHIFRPALVFVLGFTTIFVLLGVSAMALGGVLQRFQVESNLIGGALVIVFGLAMTGFSASRYSWPTADGTGRARSTDQLVPSCSVLPLPLVGRHALARC